MICYLPACQSEALRTLPICEIHFVAIGRMTEVLATEPGGRALEAQRHAEFTEERIDPRREDFALSLRLQEHIRELQESWT